MNKKEKLMLKEIMIGRGLDWVPGEYLEMDSGCSNCGEKTKKLLVDSLYMPNGHEGVRGYREKIERLRQKAQCTTCILQYYWEEGLIN